MKLSSVHKGITPSFKQDYCLETTTYCVEMLYTQTHKSPLVLFDKATGVLVQGSNSVNP